MKFALPALLVAVATAASAAPLKTEVFTASAGGFLVTSTLITGEKEAILVDAQFTLSDAHRLVAKVLESGKTLTTVLVTHGHPDHYFGLEVIRAAFPKAKLVATPAVLKELKAYAPQSLAQWKPMYGANLTAKPIIPSPLTTNSLTLEGEQLELIAINGGESEAGTAVWIPSTRTLIAGDAAYAQVHPYLVGLTAGRRAQWIKNTEELEKRGATTVIPGHRSATADVAGTRALSDTAAYIRDFEAALASSNGDPEAVKRTILQKYGALELPIILDFSAKSSVPAKK